MLITSSNWSKTLLLAGTALLMFGVHDAIAQRGQAQYPRSEEENEDAQQERQVEPQQDGPFIHGVTIGAGLGIYQGDYSINPNHNIVKYIAGNGKLSLQVGADHRLGEFDQYGLGADLVYTRLSGESTGGAGFKSNSIALDFYADYELPYIKEGLFRAFIGGGPMLIMSPSYSGDPGVTDEDDFQPLGTRVIGSFKVGVTILDAFRIGTRVATTDLLDGYKGFSEDDQGVPDFVSFLNVRYRFDLN